MHITRKTIPSIARNNVAVTERALLLNNQMTIARTKFAKVAFKGNPSERKNKKFK